MTDLEFNIPVIMSEIFTLDQHLNLRIGDFSQNILPSVLEAISLGRIYRLDKSFGTGFIIGINEKGPILLTCKHVVIDMFSSTIKKTWVCFDLDQSSHSLYEDMVNHVCGKFFRMKLLDLASNLYDLPSLDIDPITNFKYSLGFDAALYLVKNKCICGRVFELPKLTPAKLYLPPTRSDENISILGYMGPITELAAPLTQISNSERNNLQKSLTVGCIAKSEGNITSCGDLYCISNPSVFGFSGGPVFSLQENGDLRIWGLFLGGPALTEHELFVRLGNKFNQSISDGIAEFNRIELDNYPLLKICKRLIKDEMHDIKSCMFILETLYNDAISCSIRKNLVTIELMNHNLCIPLYRIINLLRKYEIFLIK